MNDLWKSSASTDPAMEAISTIIHAAAEKKKRRLILVTGVPGAGKTLVGLRLAHANYLDALAVVRGDGQKPTAPAVFLSGNGPLVQVLQYQMRKEGSGDGKTFVRDVKGYVEVYSRRKTAVPPEHVLIYDEAQRAWDAEMVIAKGHTNTQLSEPELFIQFAERVPDWCAVVGLIGTGQEIHLGEEGGLARRLRIIGSTLRGRSADAKAGLVERFAAHVLPAFDAGVLRPIIDRRVPWTDLEAAHAALSSSAIFGKILVQIRPAVA